MIANALDADGKFTPRQVSEKLKKLGLSLSRKKSFRDEDLHHSSTDKADETDDVALISLVKR